MRTTNPSYRMKANGEFLRLDNLDTLWPQSGDITHAITVHPGHVYRSAKPEVHPTLAMGDQREVVYREDKTWRYLGTFECIHSDLRVSFDRLGPKVSTN